MDDTRDADSEENFLDRWSRRKQAEDRTESITAEAQVAAAEDTTPSRERELTDEDMPPIDSLDSDSDFSLFMSPGVSEQLRTRALQKLFHLPGFNITDGLNDYDDDFTAFAGLGDVVTHEMRRRLQRGLEAGDEGISIDRQDEPVLLTLGTETGNGQARAAALDIAAAFNTTPAGIFPYASAGSLLILGDESRALAAAERLRQQDAVHCTVVTAGSGSAADSVTRHERNGVTVVTAGLTQLAGYLGAFKPTLATVEGTAVIQAVTHGRGQFDLVLDLGTTPLITSQLPPPGYFAPGGDGDALRQALDEIPGLLGEFEKPVYFQYDASICAHGRSGMTACTRCLDACPSDAITSLGDRIEVNPGLCQGAGSCATACPSGAIRYNYPRLDEGLERLRALLKGYRDNGGTDAVLLFHDGEAGRNVVAALSPELPENILPVELEELGSTGIDTWLAALSYGAAAVVLLGTPRLPQSVRAEIHAQLEIAGALLAGMGYSPGALCYTQTRGSDLLATLAGLSTLTHIRPAGFAGLDEKRTVIRLAVEHLYDEAPKNRPLVSLPAGAPFGDVLLDRARCTLCMACVSQCPAGALSAGDETPQLGFIEANCVQCGLCCRTCPEDAIAITPRYLYDFQARSRRRILHEEAPFACIRCGKPFASRRLIENITARMRGHAMFQGAALERIRMCEDCRVRDIYGDEEDVAQIRIEPDRRTP